MVIQPLVRLPYSSLSALCPADKHSGLLRVNGILHIPILHPDSCRYSIKILHQFMYIASHSASPQETRGIFFTFSSFLHHLHLNGLHNLRNLHRPVLLIRFLSCQSHKHRLKSVHNFKGSLLSIHNSVNERRDFFSIGVHVALQEEMKRGSPGSHRTAATPAGRELTSITKDFYRFVSHPLP